MTALHWEPKEHHEVSRTTCRLCGRPISDEGYGFYHDDREMGVSPTIRAHFACPVQAVAS